jgi:hypothetical protein
VIGKQSYNSQDLFMFSQVKVRHQHTNASDIPPSQKDCDDILEKLNSNNFTDRIQPTQSIVALIDEAYEYSQQSHDGFLNCHTITRFLTERLPCNSFNRSFGYLVQLDESGQDFFHEIDAISLIENGITQVDASNITDVFQKIGSAVSLSHHSVILDNNGNNIECLFQYYSPQEYKFISHDSGELGYNLFAHY